MAKHVFNLEELFDTVEVGKQSFQLNLNDHKLREFRKMAAEYGEKAQEIAAMETEGIDEAEFQRVEQAATDLLKWVLDGILGAGSYEKIFVEVGENSMNVATFVEYLFGLVEVKLKETKKLDASKYTKKPGAPATKARKAK